MEFNPEVSRIVKSMEVLQKLSPQLPLNMCHVFLCVAAKPGISTNELVEQTGLSQASISRNLTALGKIHRNGKPGFDVVQCVEDPNDRRRNVSFLAPKGKYLLEEIVAAHRGVPAEDVKVNTITAKQAHKQWERNRLEEITSQQAKRRKEKENKQMAAPQKPMKRFCPYCGENIHD
ncbi:MarR family winged helix-turn-helix transcriptional regulator [Pseudovibrio ascidiaceicola]|uniref:MarR family winged helix-turn-helix transcriptional regulator n=1 Tax=Pseudovibrio ascidiaceicola TaxID=285279 RepID=UPI003D364456